MIWATLVVKCAKFEPNLRDLLEDCDKLTDYAVDVRYPDIPTSVEEQVGREAVALAERICEAIRSRLPQKESRD